MNNTNEIGAGQAQPKRAGRKPFIPTKPQREMVEFLVSLDVSRPMICKMIINPETKKPIDKKVLSRVFKNEIETGAIKTQTQVANALYNKAVKGDTRAAIFWLKSRAGWKETSDINVRDLSEGTDDIPEQDMSIIENYWNRKNGRNSEGEQGA